MKQISNIIEQHIDLLVENIQPDGIKIEYCPSSSESMACEVWATFTFVEGDGEGCVKKYQLSSIQGDDIVIADRGTEYEPPLDERDDPPKGTRRGQLRYYLRTCCWYDVREHGIKFAWNHFWCGRWFWSAGRLGKPPVGYTQSYWTK